MNSIVDHLYEVAIAVAFPKMQSLSVQSDLGLFVPIYDLLRSIENRP